MLSRLEFAVGLLIWCGVLWDGFATIILPRTVKPMRRLSGRFYRWSWRLWAAVGITSIHMNLEPFVVCAMCSYLVAAMPR